MKSLFLYQPCRLPHRCPQTFLSGTISRRTTAPHPTTLLFKRHVRNKVVNLDEAVAMVRSNDTLVVSGFVGQGCPDALCEALAERYKQTKTPSNLTLLFGGGPGDWNNKGLNHLALEGLLKRTIGSHYGQIPRIGELALNNKIEAYNWPLGTILRMIRDVSRKGPGYITTIGFGTFVDPRLGGGKMNSITKQELVEVIQLGGKEYLWYPPIPIHVAFIRATTADTEGNLTMERESLIGDVRNIAMATKNSGGIVIAQVARIAAKGSLHPRQVRVPGVMVDCVYPITPDKEDRHDMSFSTKYNPALSQEIVVPLMEDIKNLPMNERKIISRRAAKELKPNMVVNLGIGMPEGVTSVAREEQILKFIILTTEAGVIGGLGASGHDFGPAINPEAITEMNQQFDYYNGGGLDCCFLGLAQVNEDGNVNVSRLSKSHVTGPGGFVDISQSTQRVIFVGTFMAKGLSATAEDGKLKILSEGQIRKFTKNILEVTFNGNEATKRGQTVLYITERCVFKKVENGIELIEIAPGVDLQKDILANMDFVPHISKPLKIMDSRIFYHNKMGLRETMFPMNVVDRLSYLKEIHTLFVDVSGLTFTTSNDVDRFFAEYEPEVEKVVGQHGPVRVVANYDGFDCREEASHRWLEKVAEVEKKYYRSATRYTRSAFLRYKMGQPLHIHNANLLWHTLDKRGRGYVNREELRLSLRDDFGINITPEYLEDIMAQSKKNEGGVLDKEGFFNSLGLLMEAGLSSSPDIDGHH